MGSTDENPKGGRIFVFGKKIKRAIAKGEKKFGLTEDRKR